MRRERFKIVVWTIVAANVLLFAGMLIQGCKREPATAENKESSPVETASAETNAAATAQPAPGSNLPTPPTFEAPTTNAATAAAETNAPPPPAPAGGRQYSVAKGDTFYKIAKANKTTVKALEVANPGVSSAKLKVGQVLQLPAGAEPAAATAAATPPSEGAKATPAAGHYVVKRGDTLDRIARSHRTTVQAIKAANGLTSDHIVAGRNLKLPESKTSAAPGTQA